MLELWYGDKWHKTLTAKKWASRDGLSIREMEWHMDGDMFLDEYPHWEAGRLHCNLILQEMFLQAAHSGWKEAEQMICQGCWHGHPHLDSQWTSPPSNWWGTRPLKKKSGTFITRFINLEECQDLCCADQSRYVN